MNYYDIWCNLKDTSKDLTFCDNTSKYLTHLRDAGLIEGFRIRRRKLGFGPSALGEFNFTLEVRDLAQLERTFQYVATRGGEIERLHAAVYTAVVDAQFALSRDFPDPCRTR